MQFDIIIIGGGMVGAAMACALRDHGLKLALIDASPISSAEDHRLIALNYSSVCLLKNLNLWPTLHPQAAAINEVHVSHRGHFGTTRLTAAQTEFSTLGYVIPAKYITTALYENLNHITLIRPATLKNIHNHSITIETPQGEQSLSAKIIIGADGTHSTVRELLAIPTTKTDYQQSALVTTTELNRSHHHIGYERFQSNGAIAMLPLTGNRAATIWTAPNDVIAQLKQLTDDEFLQQLQKQFGYRLGRLIKTTARYSYPLQHIQATEKVRGQVILIGNAAHTLHPIAAQGLNLALFEIAELADYFATQPLDKIFLTNFAAQQQKISTRLSHYLTSLFSNDLFIMKTARQTGMLSLDLCPALKERFISHAMGRSGKMPSLLRERETHEAHTS